MSRRFIAGAICPQCGLLDKLFINSEGDTLECANCDFRESKPATAPTAPQSPTTPPEKIRLVDE